jgi:Pyridoxamine 5'-phosphate oxidase
MMTEPIPRTKLSDFSSPGAVATAWEEGRLRFADAELYWISSVRPDGRPHVTPLLGVWFDGTACICTGPDERKAKNLAANPQCVVTTGQNNLDGLDVVIEGRAVAEEDPTRLQAIAGTYERKYGSHFQPPDGTWEGLGDAIRTGEVVTYRITPAVAFGFGKGGTYSETRWLFES